MSMQSFELRPVGERGWIILESARTGHSAKTVAHLTRNVDDTVDVAWDSALPLPISYARPEDALEHVETWAADRGGPTKPIPIPHISPPRHCM
jgi:hypothetical protein